MITALASLAWQAVDEGLDKDRARAVPSRYPVWGPAPEPFAPVPQTGAGRPARINPLCRRHRYRGRSLLLAKRDLACVVDVRFRGGTSPASMTDMGAERRGRSPRRLSDSPFRTSGERWPDAAYAGPD